MLQRWDEVDVRFEVERAAELKTSSQTMSDQADMLLLESR